MAEKPTYEELEQRIALLENESAQRKRFEGINRTLFKISNAVNMTSNLDELFQMIHLALGSIIDTTNFFISLYDRTKDSATFPFCIDTADECYPPFIEVSKTSSLTAEVIRTGSPVLMAKSERLARLSKSSLKNLSLTPAEIWLGVPLKTRNEIIGVMAVQSYNNPMCYDQTDMDVMVSVADQVAIAIERKQVEVALLENNNLLTQFVKHSPIFCYIKDVTSTRSVVLQASDNFQQMIGIPGYEMIGKTMEELYPAAFAAKITADDWTVVSKGDVLRLDEDLNGRSYTTIKFPIVQGDKTLLAGYTIEITERKLAEVKKAELEAQYRQLLKAESLSIMAGATAHHFNNQLQAVMGNLEMAMDDQSRGADTSETLSEALNAAHKAAEVSGLMLTYLGQTPGKHEPMDLSELCRRSLTLLQSVDQKGMIFNAELPASGPVIRANASQIEQVLTNLITNAREAAGENGGAIGLKVKTVSLADIPASKRFPIDWQPRESVYACLEVADKGHGIPDRDIEKIFDPFFTTKFTGRGLGLPVVLGIAGAHGGGVTVENEPGRGSVFSVFLPVPADAVPCRPLPSATNGTMQRGKSDKTPIKEGNITVLLIEDEEQVRKMANIMLTRLGYTVLEAKDGIEAVEVFQQHQDKIRWVLSDLTMPRMDGWDTLAALRKLSPDIPVILSSGYDEARVMAGDHPERPNAFLGKPYQFKVLCDTIHRILS